MPKVHTFLPWIVNCLWGVIFDNEYLMSDLRLFYLELILQVSCQQHNINNGSVISMNLFILRYLSIWSLSRFHLFFNYVIEISLTTYVIVSHRNRHRLYFIDTTVLFRYGFSLKYLFYKFKYSIVWTKNYDTIVWCHNI